MQELIKDSINVVMIAETKTDASLKTVQFLLDNYHEPLRLNINSKSGGILVYVKSSVPSRKLKYDILLKSIQAIPCKINLRKEEWLVISIYHPPSQDSEFLFWTISQKAMIITWLWGYFNLEPPDKRLGYFLNSNNLVNFVGNNACFKGNGSCFDLILKAHSEVWDNFRHLKAF